MNKLISSCLFLVFLATLNLTVHAQTSDVAPEAVAPETSCPVCDTLTKFQNTLLDDIEFYRTRMIKSEKYNARTALLKELGKTANEINKILVDKNLSDEVIRHLAEMLVKIDNGDGEHILLERIDDSLKPYASKVKADAKTLLNAKTVTQASYASFMASMTYLESGAE